MINKENKLLRNSYKGINKKKEPELKKNLSINQNKISKSFLNAQNNNNQSSQNINKRNKNNIKQPLTKQTNKGSSNFIASIIKDKEQKEGLCQKEKNVVGGNQINLGNNKNNFGSGNNFNKNNNMNINNGFTPGIQNNKIENNEYIILKDKNEKDKEKKEIQDKIESTDIISCLYCFENNEKLREYILSQYIKKNILDTENYISFFLCRIFKNFKTKDKEEYNIKCFYENITKVNNFFINNINAIYFIVFFLQQLHEEDKQIRNIKICSKLNDNIYSNITNFKKYLNKEENTFIYNNYSWINEKTITCIGCKHITKIYSYFLTFDLNIDLVLNKYVVNLRDKGISNKKIPPLTIQQCINYRKDKEILYNVYCASCDKKINLIRSSKIYSSSNYFIILLSDIEKKIQLFYDNDIKIQINKEIYLETTQDINETNNRSLYKINSIIYYDLKCNRYISYCYKNNEIWTRNTSYTSKEEKTEDFLNKFDYNMVPVIIFYEANK